MESEVPETLVQAIAPTIAENETMLAGPLSSQLEEPNAGAVNAEPSPVPDLTAVAEMETVPATLDALPAQVVAQCLDVSPAPVAEAASVLVDASHAPMAASGPEAALPAPVVNSVPALPPPDPAPIIADPKFDIGSGNEADEDNEIDREQYDQLKKDMHAASERLAEKHTAVVVDLRMNEIKTGKRPDHKTPSTLEDLLKYQCDDPWHDINLWCLPLFADAIVPEIRYSPDFDEYWKHVIANDPGRNWVAKH